MKSSQSWEWQEVALPELGSMDFETCSARFRRNVPVGLVSSLKSCDEVLILNLLSPIGTLFWGCPHADDTVSDYASGRAASRFVKPHLAKIKKELKAAGIAIDGPGIGWVAPLRMSLQTRTSAAPSLSRSGVFLEHFRHQCLAVPCGCFPELQERLTCEMQSFGPWAFYPCAEEIDISEQPSTVHPIGDARLIGFGAGIRECTDDELKTRKSELVAALKETVQALEQTGKFDFSCHPRTVVAGVAAVSYDSSVPTRAIGAANAEERQILALRSRLIRLLGWPVHFAFVREVLSPSYPQGVQRLDIDEPYNVVGELKSYVDELRNRYPVLRSAVGPE